MATEIDDDDDDDNNNNTNNNSNGTRQSANLLSSRQVITSALYCLFMKLDVEFRRSYNGPYHAMVKIRFKKFTDPDRVPVHHQNLIIR